MDSPLFELHRQCLRYQNKIVLNDIDLRIFRGERIALLGGSGAGKSTLLKALRQQCSAEVAWCPQQPGLVPMLSVFHNIHMGNLQRHGFFYNLLNLVKPLPAARSAVDAISGQLGLHKQLFHSAEQLSGGQQQRTSIGRALIQQRPIFIGDEPVANVDEYQAAKLLELICQRHATVVLALHDIAHALTYCTRVIGLKKGTIALDAPSAQLRASDLAHLYDAE